MDHLFTPWRMDYIRSAKHDGCIFCEMLEMKDRDRVDPVSRKARLPGHEPLSLQ